MIATDTPLVHGLPAAVKSVQRNFTPRGFIDRIGMGNVTTFIGTQLDCYDTSLIEWIKLLPLNQRRILHGECACPVAAAGNRSILEKGYRLRASVNVEAPPPYRFTHWGRIPAPRTRQGWLSGAQEFHWDTLEEVAVHTLAHECYHYLCYTGQLRMKNTEANANWWADRWLSDFRMRYVGDEA